MRNLFLYTILFIPFFSLAQQQAGTCGLSYEEGLLVREQMFRNRQQIAPEQVEALLSQRSSIWIPLVIHLVGNSQGQGFASPSNVLSMVCRLNDDFAPYNLQFYIKDSLRYVMDDIIYADAYDSVSIDRMILLKDTTAANVFVNAAAGGGVAGYYSRRGDFVFMLNGYAVGSSTTFTHEMGHFFTLPHTFFGWENIDARQLYSSTPAPDSVGTGWRRREVEYVDRSGPLVNCYDAADGFCDTDADYISQRAACPLSGTALDPSGTPIAPNPVLYMSYFLDNCMTTFTAEQNVAMISDVINRTWTSFPAPNNSALSSQNTIPLHPQEGELVSLLNANIRLEWDTTGASAANGWVVRLERIFFNVPVATVLFKIVQGQNYIEVPSTDLMPNTLYRWQVMPYSNAYTCAPFSNVFSFETNADAPVATIGSRSISDFAQLQLMPNPVQGRQASLRLYSEELLRGTIRLYDLSGRVLSEIDLSNGILGEERYQLDLKGLSSGLYRIVLLSDKGLLSEALLLP